MKYSTRKMSHFLEHTFMLPTKFLNYTFKLSINWHDAAILSNFQLDIRGKDCLFTVIISCLPCCCVICITYCLQGSNLAGVPRLVHSYNVVVRPRSLSVTHLGYSTVNNLIWKNVHHMHRMNMQWLLSENKVNMSPLLWDTVLHQ
jgi:hypothetical protein